MPELNKRQAVVSRGQPSLQAPQPNSSVPVLYIHPAKQGVDFVPEEDSGRPYGIIPVGVAALVNCLRANGIGVRGLNYPMERQLNPRFNLKNWLMTQRGVRIILIDMHWYEHTYGAIDVARACKAALPWVKVILGGLTASGFAQDILSTYPEVDFVIRGDAEKSLLMLVQRLLANPKGGEALGLAEIPNLTYREAQSIKENPLLYTASTEDLDSLNFTDLDFLIHLREYLVHEYIVTNLEMARHALNTSPFLGRWLCTARGCRYHCSYCGGSKESHKLLAGRDGIIIRSPERIADDLEKLQQLGVIQASMSYDIAELGEDYWRMLFAEIRRRKIKIGLYNEFFQNPDVEFIRDLAHTADLPQSCVAFSPLSGNERVRRLNGKHYSNSQFFESLDVVRHHQLHIFVYFSLNLPGETEDTFEETLALAKKVYDFYPHHLLKMLNTVHTVDPVSPMAMYPQKYGIDVTATTFQDFYNYCRDTGKQSVAARDGQMRGFNLTDVQLGSLKRMADRWDAERPGREISWWPIPPSW